MDELPYTQDDKKFVDKLRSVFDGFHNKGRYAIPLGISTKRVVDIDSPTALDAVQSWERSIKAYGETHEQPADLYMQVAFMACHIVKTKPIFLAFGGLPLEKIAKEYEEYFDRRYAEINEHFALAVALNFLGIEPDQIEDNLRKRIVDVLYKSPLDPAHLALTFEMLYNRSVSEARIESLLQQAIAQLPSQRHSKK